MDERYPKSPLPSLMKSKPRIALVVPVLAEGGGVPTVAEFLYQVLDESNLYQPDFISLATSSKDQASLRFLSPKSWSTGLQIVYSQWRGREYRHVGCRFAEFEFQRYRPRRVLTELLDQYDLVQVVAGAPAWATVAREVRRPVCLFVATLVKQERKSAIKRKRGWKKSWLLGMTNIITKMERRALSSVSCVFAESQYTLRLLSSMVSQERLRLGPPGVDTRVFYPGSYRPNGYILSVGRFDDPRKNISVLFEAYSHLREGMLDAPRLMIAGKTGPSFKDMNLALSLGIAEHIEIKKNISAAALAELYRNASLFVLSSDEEGLGIVILEAMASGLPVISTRCGGPETAIVEEKTGFLTPVGDSLAMASRMKELLSNPFLCRSMGEAAREVAQERFSFQAAGKIYLAEYDRLLAG